MAASVDVFSSHHTISPVVLASSRPTTPAGPSAQAHAGPSSQPAREFDPHAYIDLADLHQPSAFDPASFVDLGVGSHAGGGAAPLDLPFATGSMSMARTGSSSSGGDSVGGPRTRAKTGALPRPHTAGAGGSFVSFDPDEGDVEGGLDQDDVSDEDDRAVEGRPRKRKSVRDLRGAAQSQAGPSASALGAGAAKDDGANGDEDKTRRKISIEYIEEKSKRHITFSKRKAGIMKKAYELSTLTGTQVLLLVVSESGWVYTFTTDKFKPLVKEDENGQLSAGQKLIAACLEAKDGLPDLSAAYHTAASSTGNFEANSAVHGGQISLKTGARARPVATNRRVSSRGRANIPTAIHIGGGGGGGPMDPSLPCPPGSGGIPPVPQLPTPMSGNYLDPLSPTGPHSGGSGPRSLSHPPISPARPGSYSLQQQQQEAHAQQQQNDYAEMMQRADMLHLQQQQQQQHHHHPHQHHGQPQSGGGGYGHDYDLYGTPSHHNLYLQDLPLPPPPPHLQQAHSHALRHQPSHDSLPPPPQQQQQPHPQTLHHARSFSHGGGGGGGRSGPHTPHRTLHHQASHGHLGGDYSSGGPGADQYGGAGGNYTHAPPGQGGVGGGVGGVSAVGLDPRRNSSAASQGWSTPQGHRGTAPSSAQGTPLQSQQGQALYVGGGADDGYGH